MLHTSATILKIILFVVFLFGAGGGFGLSQYRKRRRAPTIAGSSVLLDYYTDGADLVPVKKGTLAGMYFNAMAVTGLPVEAGTPAPPSLIYRLELAFDSSLHLVGIPKYKDIVQLDPSQGGLMEKVELEGNFDDYFSLFCQKGMQVQARYVMDPKAMLYAVDFLGTRNWEILGSELYLVVTTSAEALTSIPLEQAVQQFVSEISPQISQPLSSQALQLRTPYGEERRTDLKCPICSTGMPYEKQYFKCRDRHGVLIEGRYLKLLREKKLVIPDFDPRPVAPRTTALFCPACGELMGQTPYNGSATAIDSCPACPYRWLDSGEVASRVSISDTV